MTLDAAQAGEARDVDPRHAGRVYDKEMPIRQAGMELAKPGLPDLRRRKYSIALPEEEASPEADTLAGGRG